MLDGTKLGFATHHETDQIVVFTHTEVDSSAEGQGMGSQLIRGTLRGVRLVPRSERQRPLVTQDPLTNRRPDMWYLKRYGLSAKVMQRDAQGRA